MWPCPEPGCGYIGRLPEYLRIHARQHTGERPYACAVCGSAYTTRSARLHHARVHALPARISCARPGCGYETMHSRALARHGRAAGHAALACPVPACGALFLTTTTRAKHLRSPAHAGPGRTALCPICAPSLASPAAYREHLHGHLAASGRAAKAAALAARSAGSGAGGAASSPPPRGGEEATL